MSAPLLQRIETGACKGASQPAKRVTLSSPGGSKPGTAGL